MSCCPASFIQILIYINKKINLALNDVDEYIDNINKIIELEEVVIENQPDLITLNDYMII
jgi:hypothetical protein